MTRRRKKCATIARAQPAVTAACMRRSAQVGDRCVGGPMPPLNLDLTAADREALQPFLDPMYGSEQQVTRPSGL